jgi:L-lactate utilization protein LutB
MKVEELQNKYIASLKEQLESYKKISELNDDIIDRQKHYIEQLERLLKETKELVEESVLMLKNVAGNTVF